MRKLIAYFCLLIILLNFHFSINADEYHTQSLKNKFPFGLIGDDFGILNEKDLEINTCFIDAQEQFSEHSTTYPYWQCFDVKNINLYCEGKTYDEEEKDFLSILFISGINEKKLQKYISRRAIPYSSCQKFLNDWKYYIINETHVCVSGEFTEKMVNHDGQKYYLWIFDKFKSKKGCSSYFVGGCDLNYQLKNGCHKS